MELILTSFIEPVGEIEGLDSESVKQDLSAFAETSGSDSVEDSQGRSKWIKTRKCFCPSEAETDCRFHSQKKQGWAVCPHTPNPNMKVPPNGIWLWARNPLYGKPLTTEEKVEAMQELALG